MVLQTLLITFITTVMINIIYAHRDYIVHGLLPALPRVYDKLFGFLDQEDRCVADFDSL
jgi:hypothetical protein